MSNELIPGKWYKNKLQYEFSSNRVDDGYWHIEVPMNHSILFLEKIELYDDYCCTLKFLWDNKIVYCHCVIDEQSYWL